MSLLINFGTNNKIWNLCLCTQRISDHPHGTGNSVFDFWLARWFQNSFFKGCGFDTWHSQLFGLGRGQWRDSVSSVRVNPALNGYLEKSGEGN